MHAINKDWGWNVHKFANYANVGVEDLTFKGHAKEKNSSITALTLTMVVLSSSILCV